MTRWLRFLLTYLGARSAPPLALGAESLLHLRAWPTECDASWLNHAALLSLMECGRVDIMVRMGFLALARRRGWYLPLASVAARFDRPLRRLQRFDLASRIAWWDEAAIWIEHRVTRDGRLVATGLARCPVREGRAPVAPERILRELGLEVPPAPPRPSTVEAIEAWTEAAPR
jgi:acyl-CoA thioesterase FadM